MEGFFCLATHIFALQATHTSHVERERSQAVEQRQRQRLFRTNCQGMLKLWEWRSPRHSRHFGEQPSAGDAATQSKRFTWVTTAKIATFFVCKKSLCCVACQGGPEEDQMRWDKRGGHGSLVSGLGICFTGQAAPCNDVGRPNKPM